VSAPCKILEQGGAGLKLWPKNVGGTYQLLVRDPGSGSFMEVTSYMHTHGCNGPVSRMIKGSLQRTLSAINTNPTAFTKNNPTGISLVQLLRTTDVVTRSGSNNDHRLHPFARR
jgi:hypothetical protein